MVDNLSPGALEEAIAAGASIRGGDGSGTRDPNAMSTAGLHIGVVAGKGPAAEAAAAVIASINDGPGRGQGHSIG